MIASH